ncbi:MmgE/PrpD family protein [Martelella alba]|uniref:MmgE/PrpD family protein n=1 Tax=Martelella alba TaxID=2590451 RepID=A0ABY2SQP3_9HYPH|nr:MmgE/PrpD family protein [Martelella alba]TKI07803.1 MmgE/PrpD family protein [Martelella alba]
MSVETTDVSGPVTKTRQLGIFAASMTYESLPPEVIHYGKRAFVDWSAAAIAGAGQPGARKLQNVISSLTQGGTASVVGTRLRTNAPYAALCNAYASHLLDYDDVFNPIETTIHLSSCVWPTVVAIGQLRALNGREMIAAYVAGFETGARVAQAAGNSHYQSAWHVTGTMGHIAAAAAAANALKLSAEAATHALGCSATQAAGIREIYGSDAKAIHPGKAAMDGVMAGLLAEVGFTSMDTAIEGQRGLLNAVSQDPDYALLVAGLNHLWHLPNNGHKLYPTASLTHAPIEAGIAASADLAVKGEPDAIELRLHPFSAAVTALAHPTTGSEARFSTPHCLAVALARGRLGLGDFDDATLNDSAIVRLRSRVRIHGDSSMDKRGCKLVIHWADGRHADYAILRNRGTPDAPLSDPDLSDKLIAAVGGLGDSDTATGLVEQCWALDQARDINGIMKKMTDDLAG